MPYFIYKLKPFHILEKLEQYDKYKDASSRLREIRQDIPIHADYSIRLVFGENELLAEDALNTTREPDITTGEDY